MNYADMLNNVTQGDCLEVMRSIPDNAIDMVLADLPYAMTKNKWDKIIPLDELWEEYHRIVKPNGVFCLTASGAFLGQLICSNIKEYKYKYVWEKDIATNFLNAKKQPLRKHEDVLVFYRKYPTYNEQKIKGKPYNTKKSAKSACNNYSKYKMCESSCLDGMRHPKDIIYFKTALSEHGGGGLVHPTQKPVELGRWLIRTYTNEGDTVLDNTCGSGTFLVSALLEGRNFVGIEKNDNPMLHKVEPIDYVGYARDRILREIANAEPSKLQKMQKCGLLSEKILLDKPKVDLFGDNIVVSKATARR